MLKKDKMFYVGKEADTKELLEDLCLYLNIMFGSGGDSLVVVEKTNLKLVTDVTVKLESEIRQCIVSYKCGWFQARTRFQPKDKPDVSDISEPPKVII